MKVRSIALTAALFVGLSNMAGVAVAQTKVFVVNTERVLTESKVGKEIGQTIETSANARADELGLKQLKSEIDAEAARLKPQTESLTKEAVEANPTLKAQLEALLKKRNDFYNKSNALNSGIERADNSASQMLLMAVTPAVNSVAKDVNADIVLNTTQVWFAKPGTDITDKVIARLDATVPTLKALQDSLPKPPAKPPAAGGGQ